MNGLEKLGYKYTGKGTYLDSTLTYDEYRKQDDDIIKRILIDKKYCRKKANYGDQNFTREEIIAVAEILKEDKSNELEINRILKKRKINIFGLDLEMKLHPEWTLDQRVEYNNDGLPTPYHVTKEEMKLVIEWMQKKESEEKV
jgi:hypothetical protein